MPFIALLLAGCVSTHTKNDGVKALPDGNVFVTVASANPPVDSYPYSATTGQCGRKIYTVSVHENTNDRPGYVALDVNHRTVRKYSDDVPFAHDLLRQKQMVRLSIKCGFNHAPLIGVRHFAS